MQLLMGMSTRRYLPAEGDRGLGAVLGEREEPGAGAAAHDDARPRPAGGWSRSRGSRAHASPTGRPQLTQCFHPDSTSLRHPGQSSDGLILAAVRAEIDRAADRQSSAAVGAPAGGLGLAGSSPDRDRARPHRPARRAHPARGSRATRRARAARSRVRRVEHPRQRLGAERRSAPDSNECSAARSGIGGPAAPRRSVPAPPPAAVRTRPPSPAQRRMSTSSYSSLVSTPSARRLAR